MKFTALISLAGLALCACQPADTALPVCERGAARCISVNAAAVRAIDGDTYAIDQQRFRLAGWDSPEAGNSAGCATEAELGVRAEVEAMLLISNAEIVTFETMGTDQYDRIRANIWIDDTHIGELLHAKGLAQPLSENGAPQADWCP